MNGEMRVQTGCAGDSLTIHVDAFDHNNVSYSFPIEIEVQQQDKPRLVGVRIQGFPVFLRGADHILHATAAPVHVGEGCCACSGGKCADEPAPAPSFWLVWREGSFASRYRHDSERSARVEAERLAKANPGSAFYVLPASDYALAELQPVSWKKGPVVLPIASDEEVPF